MFEFKLNAKDKHSHARTGEFTTPHGILSTPALATVATEGVIKAIPKEKIAGASLPLLIVNTFHLWTKKIVDKFNDAGAIHAYAGFEGPIESDSGGFQVFSLGFAKTHNVGKIGGLFPGKKHKDVDINNPLVITEEGVSFLYDNQKIRLTPEKSIQIQQKIGADIMFAFDECTSPLNSYEYTKTAMERTHRWLARCLKVWETDVAGSPPLDHPSLKLPQALFAIVQGGYFKDLRTESAKFVGKQDVPGFGIGGSLGKTKEEMLQVVEWTIPHLSDDRPRHLLGIGQIRDLFEAVERGVDLFDCVIPTREARHKVLYTKKGKLQLRKMKLIDGPIEADCGCETCRSDITLKKLYLLFLAKDPLGYYYATIHNLYFFKTLMESIQKSIAGNTFHELKAEYFKKY